MCVCVLHMHVCVWVSVPRCVHTLVHLTVYMSMYEFVHVCVCVCVYVGWNIPKRAFSISTTSEYNYTNVHNSNHKTYSTAQMYSSKNPAIHAMNSIAMVFFLPRNSIIKRVTSKPACKRVLETECHKHTHLQRCTYS